MPSTSTPLTPNQIRAALKKFGCKVREVDGWETRNRNGHGNGFGPVYGFGVHHTGDDAPDTADRNVIIKGRTDLPGPLAQFGLNDDGTVDLIGCGRANHFGSGDSRVLAAVRDEAYGDYPPKPTVQDFDGNGRFYGVETYYSGKTRPLQYDAMVNLAAAICDAHGWTAKSVIGHKEWSYVKPDPGSVDMAAFRRAVDARIKAVNSGPTTPAPPTPAAPASGGLTMSDVTDIIAKLDAVSKQIGDPLQRKDGTTIRADHAWQNADRKARFEALTAAVQALAGANGADPAAVAGIVDKAVRDRLAQVRFDVTDTPTP